MVKSAFEIMKNVFDISKMGEASSVDHECKYKLVE
jgi:hypothetical protein